MGGRFGMEGPSSGEFVQILKWKSGKWNFEVIFVPEDSLILPQILIMKKIDTLTCRCW